VISSSIQKPKLPQSGLALLFHFTKKHKKARGGTKKHKATRRTTNGELVDIPAFRNKQKTNSVQMDILSKQIDTTN
jgi:hypothetical protein